MDGIKFQRYLWGEIQNCPVDASKLWIPIHKYDIINNTEPERNIETENPLSDTISLATEDEQDLNSDPIGLRLIELRKYHVYLNKQLRLQTRYRAEGKKIFKRDYCVPPLFPKNYPFSERLEKTSFNTQKMIKCNGAMSKNALENKIKDFVKRVIVQAGFIEYKDEVVNYLSIILDDFLLKFVTALRQKKDSQHFSKDKDLWNAFETTLRFFGMGGVSSLHYFYYENVVKKHDILERNCNDIYDQLQKF